MSYKLFGYFCPECQYVIQNDRSIYFVRPENDDGTKGITLLPYCAYHKIEVKPEFEEIEDE